MLFSKMYQRKILKPFSEMAFRKLSLKASEYIIFEVKVFKTILSPKIKNYVENRWRFVNNL